MKKKIILLIIILLFTLIGCSNNDIVTGNDIEVVQNIRTINNAKNIQNSKYKLTSQYVEGSTFYGLVYLGYVESVPLDTYFKIQYTGGKTSYSLTTVETSAEVISKAVDLTKETSTSICNSITLESTLSISNKYSVEVGYGDIAKAKAETEISSSFTTGITTGSEVSKGVSFSKSYSKSAEYSKEKAFSFTGIFDGNEKHGYYRYNLLGTIDYFCVLTIDMETKKGYCDNIGYVSDTYFGWEYSESSKFDDKEYEKLEFDVNLINQLDFSELTSSKEVDIWDGTIADGFSGGDGTSESPYIINSSAEFAFFSEFIKDENNNSKNFELNVDLDLNNLEWNPCSPFYGTFNGNNYTIKNLKINEINISNLTPSEESSAYYIGLFQYIHGTVKNLRIENANIDIKNDESRLRVGILAGGVLNGCLNNIHVLGDVKVVSNDVTDTYTVWSGLLSAYSENSDISNCSANGDILCTARDIINIGGLLGRSSGSNIEECISSGTIQTMSYNTNTTYNCVGGLLGRAIVYSPSSTSSNDQRKTIVKNCYSTMNVSAEKAGGRLFIASFIGVSIGSEISYSYCVGDVTGKSTIGTIYAAGFIAECQTSSVKNIFTLANVESIGSKNYYGRVLAVAENNNFESLYFYDKANMPSKGNELLFDENWYCETNEYTIKSANFQNNTMKLDSTKWKIENGTLPILINLPSK